MRTLLICAALGLGVFAAPASAQVADPNLFDGKSGPRLRHFASEQEFFRYVNRFREPGRRAGILSGGNSDAEITVTGSRIQADDVGGNPEITNNQTRGVDEGGIVKQIGHHLIVLQDGRLFSVDLGTEPGAKLRLAGRIDVYRDEDKAADWYDEMLVFGNRILVTAYNYEEEASEITVVRMAPDGSMKREGRWLIGSGDYYSTDNYATRLVGDSLVLYTPLQLRGTGPFQMPKLRRARGDGRADRGRETLNAVDVYAPPGEIDYPVLHTVSICPIVRDIECRTVGIVGSYMREFFVSPDDVFLWAAAPENVPWGIDYGNMQRMNCPEHQDWSRPEQETALIYRVPIGRGKVGAVAAEGVPADQFAFDSREGRFRALLRDRKGGCLDKDDDENAVWPLALLDIPLSAFGETIRHIAPRNYTPLPSIGGTQVENRFMGDWLVYGGRAHWGSFDPDTDRDLKTALFAVPLKHPRDVSRIMIPHNAIRIERAGPDAVVTGYRDRTGMSVSYIGLGDAPRLASTLVVPGRFESEGRSHAFGAMIRRDGSGLIGLPTTVRTWRADRSWSDSASSDLSYIAFGADKRLTLAGELSIGERRQKDTGYSCEVSCIDWYGNSRPIFTGGRIFALMGTDLVEGELRGGRIVTMGRVDMTGPVR